MPEFLGLPRELRDMVYKELLTSERPRPSLGEAQWLFRYRRVFDPRSIHWGEYGCAYTQEDRPRTVANFLQCNRQIYAEMMEMVHVTRRKGLGAVKLDCIAEDESFHYFTWLSIPLVKTTLTLDESKSRIIPGWADRIMERYLTCPHRMLSSWCSACRNTSTTINQLWVDIRLFGDRSGKWSRNSSPPDRTSWALCAALTHVFEKGPNFSRTEKTPSTTTVDELVLNVVAPPGVPENKFLDEDHAIDGPGEGVVHPHTVARELVDVWHRIWTGADFKGKLYQALLERIKRVRVCVNDETWKVRELRLELDRGQAERRRIAARVGW
ncbi:hypothetical protein EJ04DRAFT_514984 [Polyplosphaeria fusca]|uniref:Uncharacterized protein n=1 Tax=Polyplosphaeria fusca TaxID=682080 RepID=A0A9P4UZ90_9PLEO|nr:hypothetical protein EJ04DRAFT_514984 [Polyplosphaeria fusca]